MADGDQDKSEQATPLKLKRARERGAVARGTDLGFLTGLTAFLACLWLVGPHIALTTMQAVRSALISGSLLADGPEGINGLVGALFSSVFRPLLSVFGVIFMVVLVFEILQTGLAFSLKPLALDFSRINPATGLKRLFTLRLLFETLKNVLKIVMYGGLAYLIIRNEARSETGAIGEASNLSQAMASASLKLLAAFAILAAIFAVLDQLIVRRDFSKKMGMSRREVRREVREREGDPRLKQQRKKLHAEFSKQSRSLRNLKGADVVITNPEHIAVALRYDRKTMRAPVVVSVGVNNFAQFLKRQAFLYGIPIIEDRQLARALYRKSALDLPIPDNCFQPVADIYNAIWAAARNRASAEE